ncbi:MAG: tetratricopeptide repeat protein [Candidatus Dojkabacteria bacterium]
MEKKTKIIIAVVSLVGFVVIVLVALFIRNSTQNSQKPAVGNPIIESYKNNLPDLAAKATNSTDPKAIRNYAVALYATGDLESAKTQYLREKELNPNDAILYNNLGNIYRDSGEYQNAVDAYQKSIDLDKSQLNVYINLANLYIYVLQKPDLGYGVYLKGIENSPNNKEALLLPLANAYKDAGLKQKAIDTYNQILAIDPSNAAVKAILEGLK